MFTDSQKAELDKPLIRSNVKSRRQGGTQVSYVEAWHVIAEANRIFGFDAWSRETIEIRCVSEKDRDIGQQRVPGFGVTYIAKVRVKVGDVVREGCGTGHGIDRDLGQAHESALKEAETDAMKRAFMTFGNQFGLALYDKEQANVEDDAHPVRTSHKSDPITSGPQWQPSEQAIDFVTKINLCKTRTAFKNYTMTIAADVKSMDEQNQEFIRMKSEQRLAVLREQEPTLMAAG